jgi:hypothetical protein
VRRSSPLAAIRRSRKLEPGKVTDFGTQREEGWRLLAKRGYSWLRPELEYTKLKWRCGRRGKRCEERKSPSLKRLHAQLQV